MIHKIKTFTIEWLLWHEITIEVWTNKSLPTIEIIWLPDAIIKESKERIRSAMRNCNIEIPARKFILNLSPSDIRKSGTSFDMPMAMALLWSIYAESLHNEELLWKSLFFWELWLDWELKRIDGLLPMIIAAKKNWYSNFFVPAENMYELEYISWIRLFSISHFTELIDHFVHGKVIDPIINHKSLAKLIEQKSRDCDFKYIKWQSFAKRALCIAASWLHNILMAWAPGCGKTLLARALQSILPPLNNSEVLEVSQIYSIMGKLNKDNPLIVHRPFRAVHHTASKISIVWWGSALRPGEVSMSHRWILFLDELTEFPRETLEVLRQPMEDKKITISRVTGSISYPADFMFVAAMNPCKCWFYKDAQKQCICNSLEIRKYQSKISWPLLDRIDMILEIPREQVDVLLDYDQDANESSEELRTKVLQSRDIQQTRYKDDTLCSNAQLSPRNIHQYIKLHNDAENLLKEASKKLQLSNRVIHRILKLSRTIADLHNEEDIKKQYLAESLQFRNKSMFLDSE